MDEFEKSIADVETSADGSLWSLVAESGEGSEGYQHAGGGNLSGLSCLIMVCGSMSTSLARMLATLWTIDDL